MSPALHDVPSRTPGRWIPENNADRPETLRIAAELVPGRAL